MSGVDDLVTWLRAQLDEDEQVARACAEVYAAPWDMSDRGHTAQVKADEPDFRLVAELEQDPAIDGWLGERLEHIARWDPARVLAEVDAKRRILDEHDPSQTTKTCCPTCQDYDESIPAPCLTVRLLALPCANRPGYRDEWRP
jgi:hypothetical protein